MADTMGIQATRAEWMREVEEGLTDMSHTDWYNMKYGKEGGKNLSDILVGKEKEYKKQGSLQQVFK